RGGPAAASEFFSLGCHRQIEGVSAGPLGTGEFKFEFDGYFEPAVCGPCSAVDDFREAAAAEPGAAVHAVVNLSGGYEPRTVSVGEIADFQADGPAAFGAGVELQR